MLPTPTDPGPDYPDCVPVRLIPRGLRPLVCARPAACRHPPVPAAVWSAPLRGPASPERPFAPCPATGFHLLPTLDAVCCSFSGPDLRRFVGIAAVLGPDIGCSMGLNRATFRRLTRRSCDVLRRFLSSLRPMIEALTDAPICQRDSSQMRPRTPFACG